MPVVARVNKDGSLTEFREWVCPKCGDVIYVPPEDASPSFRCFGHVPGDPAGFPNFHLQEPYATEYLRKRMPWWRRWLGAFRG